MGRKQAARFDAKAFLTKAGTERSVSAYRKKQVVFAQGDPADAVFYIERGQIKLTVVSERGKSAVVALLGRGDFFGEGCLAGQPLRMATASAMAEASLVRIDRQAMIGLLHERSMFSEQFMAHLLARNVRFEEDLVDQLFNSSEKRLARVLLVAGPLRQGREDRAGDSEDQSRGPGGDGRHHSASDQWLHEQVQEARLHRLQRRPAHSQFPPQHPPARVGHQRRRRR